MPFQLNNIQISHNVTLCKMEESLGGIASSAVLYPSFPFHSHRNLAALFNRKAVSIYECQSWWNFDQAVPINIYLPCPRAYLDRWDGPSGQRILHRIYCILTLQYKGIRAASAPPKRPFMEMWRSRVFSHLPRNWNKCNPLPATYVAFCNNICIKVHLPKNKDMTLTVTTFRGQKFFHKTLNEYW